MTLRIRELMDVAADRPGLWDDMIKAGGLSECRGFLIINRADLDKVIRKHFGDNPAGSLLHKAIEPVAKAVDAILGTNLANCGACAERELRLNNLTSAQV